MNADERALAIAPVVERYRNEPFMWGHHDCALFAARCHDAIAGTNFEQRILAAFRYDSAVAALRLAKAASGGFAGLIEGYLGLPEPASSLEIGDIVYGRGFGSFADSRALGVCDEEYFMVPGEHGLVWVPMKHAVHGWLVGRK